MRFLQEAVYESRARQAASSSILGVDLNAARGPGTCGLGEKAAVELRLSDRGQELFRELWPETLPTDELAAIEAHMAEWVRKNDALDRKRNHFLKDFRREHGFDRQGYSAELLREFEAGLERVNGEVRDGLAQAAERLLALTRAD